MYVRCDAPLDRSRPARENRFFIMAWTQQTHHPYGVAEEGEAIAFLHGRSVCGDDYHLNLYLNAVHEADRLIGQLIDDLRQRGLADDTLNRRHRRSRRKRSARRIGYTRTGATVSGMHERPVRAVESADVRWGGGGAIEDDRRFDRFVPDGARRHRRRADAVILARPQPARSAAPAAHVFLRREQRLPARRATG